MSPQKFLLQIATSFLLLLGASSAGAETDGSSPGTPASSEETDTAASETPEANALVDTGSSETPEANAPATGAPPPEPEQKHEQAVPPGVDPEKDAGKDPCRKGFLGLRTRPKYCDSKPSRKPEYAFLPAIFAQKETSLGFAVYNQLLFYTSKTEDVQPSQVSLTFTYTVRNQFITRIPTVLYFHRNDYVIDGYVDFRVYPNRYYGIGNDTGWGYQVYTEDVLSTFYQFRRRIAGKLYGGLVWQARAAFRVAPGDSYDDSGNVSTDPDAAILQEEQPLGSSPNFNQGFGAELVYDYRDDIFYPKRGGFYRLYSTYFGPVFGSNFNYVMLELDARQFVPLGGENVLAFQLLMQNRFGATIPFSSMAELGGPRQMRGYFQGRYRDQHYVTTQMEYRFPIYRRLGGAAFASFGEVYGSEPFRWDLLRWTFGAGLRMRFGERIYMRVDAGGNNRTGALIFAGGQTF